MNFRLTDTLLLSLVVAASGAACVPMTEHAPDRDDLFAPLHRADLAEFEYRVALDHHSGRADAWTGLAQAFIDLATCREIPAPAADVRDEPTAHLLYELVRLEDQRRMRLIRQSVESGNTGWHEGTIHTQFTSKSFFEREPDSIDEALIQWPGDDEAWPDEWPAPTEIDFECETLNQRESSTELPTAFEGIEVESATGQLLNEWYRTRQALELASEESETSVAHQRATAILAAHRADLAMILRDDDEAMELAGDAIDLLARQALSELQATAPEQNGNSDADHMGHAIRLANLAMDLDEPSVAIDAMQILSAHPNEAVAGTANYYALKLAWDQGLWDTAADLAPDLIETPSSLGSAHAYFAATAHRFAGRDDAFLGLAREALRDRRRDRNDPFLGALYREVLRELARYDVDERTEELLEELGPRSELAQRKREFAEVALDMRRPEVAEEIIVPLIAENEDARRLPRLYAVRALTAFMLDDRTTFDSYVSTLARRPEGLREAIPRSRRAAFFAHRDAELARVLRAMLPLMAEWGDDDTARSMRREWLEAIVEYTQHFLRWAPESIVSTSLTDLYKLAGQLLDDHPRGYAERVGSAEPSTSPLVLGTVDMPPSPPLDEAPSPNLRWPPLRSLLLIPMQTPPSTFTDHVDPDLFEEESS